MITTKKEDDLSIKKHIFFIFLISVILLTGCSDPWLKARIVSPIEEYRVEMSSVPGLPLELVFDIDGPEPNITSITYECTKGGLIKLTDNNVVEHQGKIAKASKNNIYWTPVDEEGNIYDNTKITVTINYYDKYVETPKTFSAKIRKSKNGGYALN